jgi:hypothetical protein
MKHKPTPLGRRAITPQPMTRDQVAELVNRVRAGSSPASVAAGVATRARWERYRAEKIGARKSGLA